MIDLKVNTDSQSPITKKDVKITGIVKHFLVKSRTPLRSNNFKRNKIMNRTTGKINLSQMENLEKKKIERRTRDVPAVVSFKTNGIVKFGVSMIRMLDGFLIINRIGVLKDKLVFVLNKKKTKIKDDLNIEIPTEKKDSGIVRLGSYLNHTDLDVYPKLGVHTSNDFKEDSFLFDETEIDDGQLVLQIDLTKGHLRNRTQGGKVKK